MTPGWNLVEEGFQETVCTKVALEFLLTRHFHIVHNALC